MPGEVRLDGRFALLRVLFGFLVTHAEAAIHGNDGTGDVPRIG
jgi:hypothetical protein